MIKRRPPMRRNRLIKLIRPHSDRCCHRSVPTEPASRSAPHGPSDSRTVPGVRSRPASGWAKTRSYYDRVPLRCAARHWRDRSFHASRLAFIYRRLCARPCASTFARFVVFQRRRVSATRSGLAAAHTRARARSSALCVSRYRRSFCALQGLHHGSKPSGRVRSLPNSAFVRVIRHFEHRFVAAATTQTTSSASPSKRSSSASRSGSVSTHGGREAVAAIVHRPANGCMIASSGRLNVGLPSAACLPAIARSRSYRER